MNKWQKLGFAAGMITIMSGAAHLLNTCITKTSTANNYTGKRKIHTFEWRFGNIAYSVTGKGSPLLLIHDLNSYSSSYEWEDTIKGFARNHTVYALDLLGCGHSNKPNITYTTYMYTQLINDFVQNVIKEKTDVIATKDSAPIVIMTAYNNKGIFNKIILVSPESVEDALRGPDKNSNIRRYILNIPIIGTTVYNMLLNKARLLRVLSKSFKGGMIPSDVLHAYHENAHIGGPNAKFLFISTECKYTTVTIGKALASLDNCIYMINGMNNDNTDTIEEYIAINPAIENVMIQDSKELPQLEQPIEFIRQAEIFLN